MPPEAPRYRHQSQSPVVADSTPSWPFPPAMARFAHAELPQTGYFVGGLPALNIELQEDSEAALADGPKFRSGCSNREPEARDRDGVCDVDFGDGMGTRSPKYCPPYAGHRHSSLEIFL
jgi:hypothetical protein